MFRKVYSKLFGARKETEMSNDGSQPVLFDAEGKMIAEPAAEPATPPTPTAAAPVGDTPQLPPPPPPPSPSNKTESVSIAQRALSAVKSHLAADASRSTEGNPAAVASLEAKVAARDLVIAEYEAAFQSIIQLLG